MMLYNLFLDRHNILMKRGFLFSLSLSEEEEKEEEEEEEEWETRIET